MLYFRYGSDSAVRYAFGSAAPPTRGDIGQRSSAQFGAALVDVRFWDLADSISVERLGPNDCNCRGFQMPALRCRRYTQRLASGSLEVRNPRDTMVTAVRLICLRRGPDNRCEPRL
jgi:hypothetical protein